MMENNSKQVSIVKVVSKNFIEDFIAWFQNFIGKNLTLYESMVNTGVEQCWEELNKNHSNTELLWHRYQITQLTNGAVAVMLYGEKK